ncbi:MAG: zinc-binding dehydrogenase [Pyrinomonadaceae bacterium]|nr:zinc-binding dehydrogenase [Pyrinomonadaceae bacterium]
MKTELMRAVVITGPNEASLQRIERWLPEPDEVLIRCEAAAVCTTERRVFSGELPYYPAIGGHEVAGVVEWVKDTDSGLKPGDRVAMDGHNRCGTCYYCSRGHNNLCVDTFKPRKESKYIIIGGGFAEYTTMLPSQVLKLQDHLSLEEASLMEPLACCLHSMKKAHLRSGDTIAVVGAGTMGALHMMLAKHFGARTIVSDIDQARLEFVKQMGADVIVNPSVDDAVQVVKDHTDGRGADAVIVAASTRKGGEQALILVGPTGHVVFYASLYPKGLIDFDWNRIHYQEITIAGTEGHTREDFHEAVALAESGAVNVRPLISRVIPLEELPAELASKPAGETQRVVVRP